MSWFFITIIQWGFANIMPQRILEKIQKLVEVINKPGEDKLIIMCRYITTLYPFYFRLYLLGRGVLQGKVGTYVNKLMC